MIITGSAEVSSNVEVFNIRTKKSCHLADLPGAGRESHTQCGRLLCGGDYDNTSQSCLTLNTLTGEFTTTTINLQEVRQDHLCWDMEKDTDPILLMGGEPYWDGYRFSYSNYTTELVSPDSSSSSASFNLTYGTV